MAAKTLATVKPDQINIATGLVGSHLNDADLETIARKIIKLAQENGGWKNFTWKQYAKRYENNIGTRERDNLNRLVSMGILGYAGGEYIFKDLLIVMLGKFIK